MIQLVGKKSNFVNNSKEYFDKKKIIIDDDYINDSTNTLVLVGNYSPSNTNENTFELYEKNISRFENFLNQNLKFKKNINIVYLSAISVYGSGWDGKTIKPSPEKKDFYSKSKLACEKLLINFCKGRFHKLFILRIPGILQKNCNRNFICSLIDKLKNNSNIYIKSPENKFNNLISIDDICKFIKLINDNKISSRYRYYNLACFQPIQIKKIIRILEKKYNKVAKIIQVSDQKERLIDLERLKNVGFIPKTVEKVLIDF